MLFPMGFVVFLTYNNKRCWKGFPWCESQLSYTISQFFVVQSGATAFYLINWFATCGWCRYNVWFSFGFTMSVNWIHHCWHVNIADEHPIQQTFLLSFHLVTEMSPGDMKTISPFWSFFRITCHEFCFRSACKVTVIYVFLFDIYCVSYTESYQFLVNR